MIVLTVLLAALVIASQGCASAREKIVLINTVTPTAEVQLRASRYQGATRSSSMEIQYLSRAKQPTRTLEM